jgi:hypothetical protein
MSGSPWLPNVLPQSGQHPKERVRTTVVDTKTPRTPAADPAGARSTSQPSERQPSYLNDSDTRAR